MIGAFAAFVCALMLVCTFALALAGCGSSTHAQKDADGAASSVPSAVPSPDMSANARVGANMLFNGPDHWDGEVPNGCAAGKDVRIVIVRGTLEPAEGSSLETLAQSIDERIGGRASIDVLDYPASWKSGSEARGVNMLIATLNATSGFASYCKAYKVNATSLYITVSGYSANMGITLSDGAVNLERTYWGYQTRYYDGGRYTTQIERNDGVVSSWAMSNFDRFYTYYSANGVQVASTIGGDTVRRTAFTEETNPDLYEQFGGDYDAYMAAQFDAIKAKFPCNRYGIKDFALGEAELAMVSHINPVGDIVWDFPNAHDAYLSGVTLEGFETGFEPGKATNGGLAEAHLLYSQVKAGNTDPINKTIIANGGTAADNGTTIRLAFQSYSLSAWVFSGYSGIVGSGDSRVAAYYGRGFRAFDIEDF